MNDVQQQAQLEDLKHRMDALEKAEIRLRVQSVGPRGCQGAPGQNAEPGQRGERGERGTGDTGRAGKDGRDAEIDINTLEACIIQILKDYGLVSEKVGPLKKFIEDTSYVPFIPQTE